ncbi:hypothetical protein LINPERHAP1_LOCUS107 [Linum perenne]
MEMGRRSCVEVAGGVGFQTKRMTRKRRVVDGALTERVEPSSDSTRVGSVGGYDNDFRR